MIGGIVMKMFVVAVIIAVMLLDKPSLRKRLAKAMDAVRNHRDRDRRRDRDRGQSR